MRSEVDELKLKEFMSEIDRRATSKGTLFLTGGATALLLGVRNQTIDIDIKLDPEPGGIFEAISDLKNSLDVNVELASPDHFIPVLPGWRDRSVHISTGRNVEFRHYDFYSQALAKIERGYDRDLHDVRAMFNLNLLDSAELLRLSEAIKPQLIKYPAIDVEDFEAKLAQFLERLSIG